MTETEPTGGSPSAAEGRTTTGSPVLWQFLGGGLGWLAFAAVSDFVSAGPLGFLLGYALGMAAWVLRRRRAGQPGPSAFVGAGNIFLVSVLLVWFGSDFRTEWLESIPIELPPLASMAVDVLRSGGTAARGLEACSLTERSDLTRRAVVALNTHLQPVVGPRV